MKPTIGRIVHISHSATGCRAAIVTRVDAKGTVSLTIFSPNGQTLYATEVAEGPADKPDTWHWPEREEA
jgi:hypothetical protein